MFVSVANIGTFYETSKKKTIYLIKMKVHVVEKDFSVEEY